MIDTQNIMNKMINFDDIVKEKNRKIQYKSAPNSWSSIKNINNWSL